MKQILFGDLKYCPADTNKDGFINEKNNIKYAGYFYDAETGLYYLNARFYDPETARFIQQDSYSGNILDPLSLNLYTYAQNNPISYYDPTGHSISSLIKKAKDTVKKAASTVSNTVKKTVNTVKTVATAVKPVVQQTVKSTVSAAKAVSTNYINSQVRNVISPVGEAVKYATNATENIRGQYEAGLALMNTPMFSSGTNAIANYYQGTYDTIMGQVEGFNQFYDNPVQTVSGSVNNFLSDPLRNNPVYGVYQYYKDVASASNVHDWNTVSYKLGVGVVNLSEFYVGGKIATKMSEIKASAAKTSNNIARKIYDTKSSYADDFMSPQPALAGGIDSSALSVRAEISSNAGGVRAGAGKNIYNSSKGIHQVTLETSLAELKPMDLDIGQKYTNIKNVHDFIRRMPDNAKRMPWKEVQGGAEYGIKYTWTDEFGNKFQARAHSLDYSAPSGTNASEGWIYRIEMKPGGTGKWHPMDSKGIFHKPNEVKSTSPMYNADVANDTHIKFNKNIK